MTRRGPCCQFGPHRRGSSRAPSCPRDAAAPPGCPPASCRSRTRRRLRRWSARRSRARAARSRRTSRCGEPAAEAARDRVHVFLRRTSHTSEEKWRALLPPTATLLDARAALERMSGREAGEREGHDVHDENGYVIDGALHVRAALALLERLLRPLDFVHTPNLGRRLGHGDRRGAARARSRRRRRAIVRVRARPRRQRRPSSVQTDRAGVESADARPGARQPIAPRPLAAVVARQLFGRSTRESRAQRVASSRSDRSSGGALNEVCPTRTRRSRPVQ